MKLPNLETSLPDLAIDAASDLEEGTKTITVFVDETQTVSPFTDTYKNEDDLVHKSSSLS